MKRLFAAAIMTALLMAAPAAAQQYPPAVNSLTVGCRTPAPGETVDVQARTFAAGAQVTVSLNGAAIGSAAADGSGIASVKATIPADTARGDYDLTASGQAPDGSTLELSTKISVANGCGAAAAPAAPGGALPRTGDDSSIPLARIGLALAALGGLITALAAKRRKAAHAAAAA
ncbi:MAG TPA: LPXTG cell wall anchor domain-containing protein [Acidimicrobiales bacterium]|nr:LPXTG cell wall anchor domain-containing protein [Acidimicrobiales bacterium]